MSKWSDEQALQAVEDLEELCGGGIEFERVQVGRAILDLRERAEKAEQRCAALEAALKKCEWAADKWGPFCPDCENYKNTGHAEGCDVAAALSGGTSALREMLEKAARSGQKSVYYHDDDDALCEDDSPADIAKRVMEGN